MTTTAPRRTNRNARPRTALLPLALLLLALALAGCRTGDDGGTDPAPARVLADRVLAYAPGTLIINGAYTDNWGTAHTVGPEQWVQDFSGSISTFWVKWYNNAGEYVIAQNDPANAYNPDKFSRFDWTLYQGALYYCQIAYAEDTADAAEAVTGADRSDPAAGGCGGFAWTRLGAPAWAFFFAPEAALGAPGGLFDVASLGYAVTAGFDPAEGYDPDATAAPGGSITLGLGDDTGPQCAVDGPGADLAVYENPFRTGDLDGDPATSDPGTNSEVAGVAVSADGSAWYTFAAAEDDAKDLLDPARYSGLAGVTPTAEGGDRFDLAGLIQANGLPADFRACYVRLTDGGTAWADYGNTQSDLYLSGADVDAVEALHAEPAPGLTP